MIQNRCGVFAASSSSSSLWLRKTTTATTTDCSKLIRRRIRQQCFLQQQQQRSMSHRCQPIKTNIVSGHRRRRIATFSTNSSTDDILKWKTNNHSNSENNKMSDVGHPKQVKETTTTSSLDSAAAADDCLIRLRQAKLTYLEETSKNTSITVDLDIFPSSSARNSGYVIVGRNGCGKSLLGKALQHPNRYIANYEKEDSRPVVSTVSFDSHVSLLRNHGNDTVYRVFGGQISKAAQFLIVRFGLFDKLKQIVHTLSTGEIRKVLLIHALSELKPDVLILDNAYDGLDVPSRKMLQSIIEKTIAGFRMDILVQGISAAYTSKTQIVQITNRVEEISNTHQRNIIVLNSANEENSTKTTLTTTVQQFYRESDRNMQDIYNQALGVPASGAATIPMAGLPSKQDVLDFWADSGRISNNTTKDNVSTTNNQHDEDDVLVCFKDYSNDRVQNILWTIRCGDCWMLMGGNGAGKSSLTKLLVEQIQQRIGWVSTERHLHLIQQDTKKELRSKDVLVSSLDSTTTKPQQHQYNTDERLSSDRIKTLLGWLDIPEAQLHTNFHCLSQGEQKMIVLANAILQRPDVLILDEPTQGLDLWNRTRFLALLNTIASSTTVVYVTHYSTEESFPAISNVLHLDHGKIVDNRPFVDYVREKVVS